MLSIASRATQVEVNSVAFATSASSTPRDFAPAASAAPLPGTVNSASGALAAPAQSSTVLGEHSLESRPSAMGERQQSSRSATPDGSPGAANESRALIVKSPSDAAAV